jgi:hypothetical protein
MVQQVIRMVRQVIGVVQQVIRVVEPLTLALTHILAHTLNHICTCCIRRWIMAYAVLSLSSACRWHYGPAAPALVWHTYAYVVCKRRGVQ